jgi:hypothetical protein
MLHGHKAHYACTAVYALKRGIKELWRSFVDGYKDAWWIVFHPGAALRREKNRLRGWFR